MLCLAETCVSLAQACLCVLCCGRFTVFFTDLCLCALCFSHSNLHTDPLIVLQAMHEAARATPSLSRDASLTSGTTARRSRRASFRAAMPLVSLQNHLVGAYECLAAAWNVYDPVKEFGRMGIPNAEVRLALVLVAWVLGLVL